MTRTSRALTLASCTTLALFLALASSVLAATKIDFINILYTNSPPQANIRVDLENPDSTDLTGPVNVTLFVRANNTEQWRQIFKYPPSETVKAGSHLALDYFTPEGNVDPAIQSGVFQIRAVAVFPDGHTSRMIKSYP